jgi:hypothetical protein
VETFTPTSTSAATGSAGGTASITTTALTINPFADLTNEEEYAIRISATCLEDDAGNAYAGIANDTTLSFTAVGDAWAGIDFTTGSVPGTVTATGGANGTRINSSGVVVSASGGRLTYNPVSPFASYGILCEPARTNLLLGSAEIDSIPRTWEQAVSGSSLSVTANAAVAPDGTTTAEELAFGAIAAAGNYAVRQQDVVSASSVKTGSVWLKAKAGGDVGLKIWVYLASQNDMVAHTLTADWVRVATTGSTATTNPFFTISVLGSTFGGENQAAVSCYAWGAQLEEGAYASSYIPTTTATVARTADSLKFTPPAGVTNIRYTYFDNTTADDTCTPTVEYTMTTGQKPVKTITDVTP